jgi:PKD repeat protein
MWSFGDGTYSEEMNPVHYFPENGTYKVCLTASSACGNDSYCDTVSICMQAIPGFDYEIINDSTVSFMDHSMHANGWIWHFGDETTSIQQNPIHVYAQPGVYHVCLTAVNECGNHTTCDTVEICFEVVAEYEFEMINDSTVQFIDQSLHPDSWVWQFDDETVSNLRNPLHMFEQSGTYHVCLTALNICSSASVCYDIDIQMPQQRIIIEPLIIYPENDQSGFVLLLPGSMNSRYMSVFNLMGKRIFYSSISPGATEFQLPDLEEGIYIIELMLDGSLYRYKIYSQ